MSPPATAPKSHKTFRVPPGRGAQDSDELRALAAEAGLRVPRLLAGPQSLEDLLVRFPPPPFALKPASGRGTDDLFLISSSNADGALFCEIRRRFLARAELLSAADTETGAAEWIAEEHPLGEEAVGPVPPEIRFLFEKGVMAAALLKRRTDHGVRRAYYEPRSFRFVEAGPQSSAPIDLRTLPGFSEGESAVRALAARIAASNFAIDVVAGGCGLWFANVAFRGGGSLQKLPAKILAALHLADPHTNGSQASDAAACVRQLKSSPLFNGRWYANQYPDVAPSGLSAAEHFLRFGADLGRNPSRLFDTSFYLDAYPDVAASGQNPLLHYLDVGEAEGRNPTAARPLRQIRMLEEMLWGGLDAFATAELERLFADRSIGQLARCEAACQLATRYAFDGQTDKARRRLEAAQKVSPSYAGRKSRVVRLAYLCYEAGDHEEARRVLASSDDGLDDPDALLLLSNVVEDDEERLSLINRLFARQQLSPITRRDAEAPLGLRNVSGSDTQCEISDIGKVSVIVPAYEAAEHIETALRSLTAQSYRNLEIIVVDDASRDGTFDIVQRFARADDRVRPVRQDRNAGAYAARNRGLDLAYGDFVTTHDADDWSHPQKIERQLAVMMQQPHVMGVLAHWTRVRPDLRITSNWRLMERLTHISHSSFMVRRSVHQDLGGWDLVRVSADTEFIGRVEAAYGKESVTKILPEAPLAFALDDVVSLTRTKATHVSTLYYGLRQYYKEIYRFWHRTSLGRLSPEQALKKQAMIPREMTSRDTAAHVVEVHVVGDCRDGGSVRAMAAYAENGAVRVGVTHAPQPPMDLSEKFARPFCDDFFALIERSNVEIVMPGASVSACRRINISGESGAPGALEPHLE
ncbi:MAG: hypothetical protein DI565_19540 [Ancylobacter novellus]|uniref:Glycosyltransferase 2-like domain-containing protein n=1 Tax=Ancylobacter novellus TaxID=921 RepID=A0A2W5K5E5_ANCNO|nr:MAG: hypothetical protein DI565_19540 [Ancylobacter novellus]